MTGEVESDLEVEVRRVVEVAVPPPAARSWTEGLVLDGDLRYRHETINDDAVSVRHRHRMRARANATATLNEDMEVGFGLSTGGIANDSGNQSFDAGFSRKSVGVDRAYFDWSLSDTLTLLGGKMSNPFFRPGGYHLLYDGDIRPEGLALRVSSGTFFANASAFWAEERGSGPDTMWYGLQAGVSGFHRPGACPLPLEPVCMNSVTRRAAHRCSRQTTVRAINSMPTEIISTGFPRWRCSGN